MDQILTRKDAKILAMKHYSTGKACSKGHVSYRYTSSGACAMCISDARAGGEAKTMPRPRVDHGPEIAAMNARREATELAISDLILTKELVNDKDIRIIFETAVALCIAEHPVLAHHKFTMPRMGGAPIRPFQVPIKHIQMFRDTVQAFWSQKPVDTSKADAYRDKMLKNLETPIPDWADRP